MSAPKDFNNDSEGLFCNLDLTGFKLKELSRKNIRIYSNDERFFVLDFVSCECKPEHTSDWNETTVVQIMFEGVIRFDGLRHLFMGADQIRHGYLYYTEPDDLIEIFTYVKELENDITLGWKDKE
jgi:hypothetical protein